MTPISLRHELVNVENCLSKKKLEIHLEAFSDPDWNDSFIEEILFLRGKQGGML